MGLRQMGDTVRLSELKGELIALRYIDDQEIISKPDWANGAQITQLVPRAEVVVVTRHKDKSLTAKRAGRTLVFQKAIANDIRGDTDWAFGLFDEFPRPTENAPDATMYELSQEVNVSLAEVEEAFRQAGLTL